MAKTVNLDINLSQVEDKKLARVLQGMYRGLASAINNQHNQFGSLPQYANNAAAIAGGLAVGTLYRNGDSVYVVHS